MAQGFLQAGTMFALQCVPELRKGATLQCDPDKNDAGSWYTSAQSKRTVGLNLAFTPSNPADVPIWQKIFNDKGYLDYFDTGEKGGYDAEHGGPAASEDDDSWEDDSSSWESSMLQKSMVEKAKAGLVGQQDASGDYDDEEQEFLHGRDDELVMGNERKPFSSLQIAQKMRKLRNAFSDCSSKMGSSGSDFSLLQHAGRFGRKEMRCFNDGAPCPNVWEWYGNKPFNSDGFKMMIENMGLFFKKSNRKMVEFFKAQQDQTLKSKFYNTHWRGQAKCPMIGFNVNYGTHAGWSSKAAVAAEGKGWDACTKHPTKAAFYTDYPAKLSWKDTDGEKVTVPDSLYIREKPVTTLGDFEWSVWESLKYKDKGRRGGKLLV